MSSKFKLLPSNYTHLNNVKMICDNQLTNAEIKEPFLNKSFNYVIIGPPASGKSSLLFSLLTTKGRNKIYYRVFKNIIYCCPKNSQSTVKDNPLSDIGDENIFNELSDKVKDRIYTIKEEYDEKKDKHYNQLLIIDDCTHSLKDNEISNMLAELSNNRRHLSLSIIILTQYLTSIPASVRSQISCAIIFKPANNKDLEKIKTEFVNMGNEDFRLLCNFVFQTKHDHLFVNSENNNLYKNLQRIIIKEE